MDIILHVTQDCQLDCVYCYGGRKQARSMSWGVARRAIDLLFDRNGGGKPQLGFFGGEPLMELPLLKQCVAYAEARSRETGIPVRFAVTTNGLAADDAAVAYMAEKQMDVILSFDASPSAQDACRRYRNGSSSFADTQAAMTRLQQRFPDLAVCSVVTPESVASLPESIDSLIGSGVSRILLNPNFFAPWDERARSLWRIGYEHAATRFVQRMRRGRPLHVSFITAKIITHLKNGYEPCECCDFGAKEIAVAPSGRLYPCQRMVGEDTDDLGLLGTVFDGLDAARCRQLADARQARNPECLRCDLRRRCRNWCSCVNHRLTGHFDATGALVCFHERMAIEIADRAASQLFAEKNETFLRTFYFEDHVSAEWL